MRRQPLKELEPFSAHPFPGCHCHHETNQHDSRSPEKAMHIKAHQKKAVSGKQFALWPLLPPGYTVYQPLCFMTFSVFMSLCQQLVMSTKACVKCCLRWCVCVGFLWIGWFPDLILHPTLVIFILLCRTNWDPYLNMKCFVATPANLFIGVSHINALHNWPTGRLFHIGFPQGLFHALTALFLLFLAFLDNQKEVESSWLAESWNCPSVSSYLLSRVLFFCFFLFISSPPPHYYWW